MQRLKFPALAGLVLAMACAAGCRRESQHDTAAQQIQAPQQAAVTHTDMSTTSVPPELKPRHYRRRHHLQARRAEHHHAAVEQGS